MTLSILIPTRLEKYLGRTIADIKEHAVTNPEILFEEDTGLGQRGITHKLAREAKGEYVMKVDAHMSFGPGFDKIMLEDMEPNIILMPYMMRLDAENWTVVGKHATSRYGFGPDFIQNFLPETDELKPESMCVQGAAWLISKENYFKWGIEDPEMPSWGGQGVEMGIKAFLNGGKCKTTKETYAAHLFRAKPEDFPYQRDEHPGKAATEILVRRYKNKSIMPLVEKFGYPLGWTSDIIQV